MAPESSIRLPSGIRSTDWSFAWSWLLGFGLVVYLALDGGGYDPIVNDQAGVVVWWVLLLAVLVGALPRRRPGRAALCCLGLLIAFVAWTGLSLRWTESTEKTAAELAMVATFLGAFALALLSRGRHGARRMIEALGAGIVVIAAVALLSRLHPAWFPEARQTGRFLETGRERLSYPLDYWNGLAALIAIGLPLVLELAAGARRAIVRAAAGAALPALILTLFFTLSRGGIAAAAIALVLYLALARQRLVRLATLGVAAIGGGVLILLAAGKHDLVHGLATAAAHSQGNQMLGLTIVACLVAGLAVVAVTAALAGARPRQARVSREAATMVAIAAVAIAAVVLLATGAPGRVSHAWDEFKRPTSSSVHGTSRLGSTSGENRYQAWSSAVREFRHDPITGTGANTFQLWWTRDGDVAAPILDAHSLYLQTLGELGIVGFALLLAFLVAALWGGGARVLRASGSRRAQLAAALAGSTALWTSSMADWTWKIPVISIAALLLIAVLVTAGDPESDRPASLPVAVRAGVAALSVAALVAIAIPLASTTLIRQSQEAAGEGNTAAALSDARSAQNVQPGAATPRIQEALLLESEGEYAAAAAAAVAATEREPTNWRTWLLLSRIEAQRGRPGAAISDYRRARALNPLSVVFARS